MNVGDRVQARRDLGGGFFGPAVRQGTEGRVVEEQWDFWHGQLYTVEFPGQTLRDLSDDDVERAGWGW